MIARGIRRVYGKLRRSLADRGLAGTLAYIPRYVVGAISRLHPARRRWDSAIRESERSFDRDRHVDTAGVVQLVDLDVVLGDRQLGHYYLGTDPLIFRTAMAMLAIDHRLYSFVDLGSGKGKALLLASALPFKSVIGVEFAPALHRIAEANLRVDHRERQCSDVRSICIDATRFDFPLEPLVVYCFNPFSQLVLAEVTRRIEESLRKHPRDVWFLYVHPYAPAPLDRSPALRLVTADHRFRLYRSLDVPESWAA